MTIPDKINSEFPIFGTVAERKPYDIGSGPKLARREQRAGGSPPIICLQAHRTMSLLVKTLATVPSVGLPPTNSDSSPQRLNIGLLRLHGLAH